MIGAEGKSLLRHTAGEMGRDIIDTIQSAPPSDVQGTWWAGLTDSVDDSHGGPTPDIARHLAVVGGQKCLLPDQLQRRQNIGYVIETPHFS